MAVELKFEVTGSLENVERFSKAICRVFEEMREEQIERDLVEFTLSDGLSRGHYLPDTLPVRGMIGVREV